MAKKKWYQQKTTWTGIAAVIGAAGAFLTGEAGLASTFQMAVTGLTAIFLRQSVNN